MLRIHDGKLVVNAAGQLVICQAIPTIVVYNSNSVVDDNFKIMLNGTQLGTINNNSNTCTGRIFSADTNVTSANCPGVVCGGFGGPPNFEPTLLLNTALLVNGLNTLRIESIQDNASGNFGRVMVLGLTKIGAGYIVSKTYVDGTYSFPSGVGLAAEQPFTYP